LEDTTCPEPKAELHTQIPHTQPLTAGRQTYRGLGWWGCAWASSGLGICWLRSCLWLLGLLLLWSILWLLACLRSLRWLWSLRAWCTVLRCVLRCWACCWACRLGSCLLSHCTSGLRCSAVGSACCGERSSGDGSWQGSWHGWLGLRFLEVLWVGVCDCVLFLGVQGVEVLDVGDDNLLRV
jgi:hypothetical protein